MTTAQTHVELSREEYNTIRSALNYAEGGLLAVAETLRQMVPQAASTAGVIEITQRVKFAREVLTAAKWRTQESQSEVSA